MFLEAIDDPTHEDHDHLIAWHGGPFDREDIDPDIVKIQMAASPPADGRQPKKRSPDGYSRIDDLLPWNFRTSS